MKPVCRQGCAGVGDAVLEWQHWGDHNSSQVTLVLLHEGLGCVALWRDFLRHLAQRTGCAVFAYSRAGYGQSSSAPLPWPTDYMTIEAQQVLPQVLKVAGITRCVLLGHSDGATIAAIYAGTVQDFSVRGMVLIAPHFFVEPISINAITQAKFAYEQGELKLKLSHYHKNVECAFRGWNDTWLSAGFKHWDVSEVIDYFRIPVLGLQGLQDQYGTLAHLNEIQSRCYAPFEQVLIDQCGHAPHREQPQQVLAAVAQFCRRLNAIGAFD